MKTEAVGYVRVSTQLQSIEGQSLPAQRERIETYCRNNGLALADLQVDAGISGSRADNRPSLQRAIAGAIKRKCPLIVCNLSRLARSTRDALDILSRLDKGGAAFVSLAEGFDTTTSVGRLLFTLIAAFSEFEKNCVVERVTATMDYLRTKDRRIGRHTPYGFDLVEGTKQLTRNEKEQGMIQTMKGWRVDGDSYALIACRLNNTGQPTKQPGGRWTATSVSRILQREGRKA